MVKRKMYLRAVALCLVLASARWVIAQETVQGPDGEFSSERGVPRQADSMTLSVTDDNINEIQEILDAAKDGDTISLESSLKIHHSKSLVIRRHVTIDGSSNDTLSSERTHFRCPEGQALFRVKNCDFTLKNVAIKNCQLLTAHGIAGIIETSDCKTQLSSNHKVHLSNVSFEKNENRGGSVGIYVRNTTCHSEIQFHNVRFEDNIYKRPSSLSKHNSLRDVSVIANKRSSQKAAAFFHFPKGSSSTVKNLTAKDNDKTVVLDLLGGEMRLLDSVFANNIGYTNGTIRIRSSSLTVEDSRFANNSCQCYGAVISADDSSAQISFSEFSENNAGDSGATVDMMHPRSVSFTSCGFTEDVMRDQGSGAAVYFYGHLENSSEGPEMTERIEFKDCVFLGIRPPYGSAVYFSEIQSRAILFESCHIENNTASMPMDNAAHVQSAIEVMNSYVEEFMTSNCTFKNNTGFRGGALSFLQTTGRIQILGNRFLGNHDRIHGGGAVFLEGQDQNAESRFVSDDDSDSRKGTVLIIDKSVFAENTGEYSSGAVLVKGESVHVTLIESSFVRNKGENGAAVCVRNVGQLNVTSCTFRDNHAFNGGGGILSENTPTTVQNCTFTKNRSQYGGAIEAMSKIAIQNSGFSENAAEMRGGAVNVNCEESNEYIENCTVTLSDCTFRGNCADRSGGAIHIYAESDLSLKDCLFRDNEAIFGGGLSFFRVVKAGQWKIVNSSFVQNNASTGGAVSLMDIVELRERSAHTNRHHSNTNSHPANNRPSSRVEIWNSTVWNNTAWSSAAGIFTEDPSLLRIDGESVEDIAVRKFNCQSMERLPVYSPFKQITFSNNTVSRGYEENLASPSTGFCVFVINDDRLLHAASFDDPTPLTLQTWKSGQDLPVLYVVMFDAFGNNFSPARNTRSSSKRLASSPEDVYDEAVYAVLSSTSETDSAMRFLKNQVYEDISSGSGNITVGKRYVKPGSYNLTLRMDGCKDQENMRLQVHVRNCTINEESVQEGEFCKPCNLNQYSFDLNKTNCEVCPEHADCRTNFTVPQKGYWNSFPCSHRMDRCAYQKACNFTGWNQLQEPSPDEMKCRFNESSVKKFQAGQCADEYTGPLCGSCTATSGRLGSFACQSCISAPPAVLGLIGILAFQLILAYLPIRETLHAEKSWMEDRMKSLSVHGTKRRTLIRCENYENSDHTVNIQARRRIAHPRNRRRTSAKVGDAIEAKRHFLGVLKITVNLLQTIAVASSFDVSWSVPAFTLFKVYDSVGGAVLIGSSFLLDCVLPSGNAVPRTVLRQITVALSPELVALLMSALLCLAEPRTDKNWTKLLRRTILAHLVVAYHSYLTVVTTAVDAFNCASVHDGIQLEDVEVTHRYWIKDTSVKCYRGTHLTLTLAVSVPLMVFAIAFPVSLAVSLASARRQHRLQWKWTRETMGFLFMVFEEKYVYWDCLILLRKAALSIIIVFGYRLGGNLQGLLALAVIAVAQFLQTHFNPFDHKLKRLNFLENVSLTVSFFTFLCGLILNDGRFVSDVVKTILTVFLLCGNIGFLAVLLFALVRFKLEQMRLEVETVLEVDCEEWEQYRIIAAYLKIKCVSSGGQKTSTESIDGAGTSCQTEIEISEI